MAKAAWALMQLAALGALVGARSAQAATFTVDTTSDQVDALPGDGSCATASGACSLRAAIQEANALAGADHITLPAGLYSLSLAGPGEDECATGDLDVHETLAIDGAGAGATTIDAGGATPVIEAGVPSVPPFESLRISGVTLRNGAAQVGDDCDGVVPLSATPGICANAMSLELDDTVVERNLGDGVQVLGALAVRRSSVRDNVKLGFLGVGVQVLYGALDVSDSTVSGNGATGIYAPAVPTRIRNSTISGNGRTGLSVGFLCEPPQLPCPPPTTATLNNVAIVGHGHAGVYNRVQVFPDGPEATTPVVVRNSVFSQNASDCDGALTSDGYNLFESTLGCSLLDLEPSDLVGAQANLGPLQANGGATETHAPLATSPAVNAANPAAPGSGGSACEAADQRGAARPIGTVCDMGAVETPCGNGAMDPGEQCDDGNATNGDGCQRNCTFAACGNGILEDGEECDDGNPAGGDCCSATCALDAAGTPCTADAHQCTDDACNGAGECQHPTSADGTPCDDGNLCSVDDQCHGGTCLGFACPPCEPVCRPGVGCVPLEDCDLPAPERSSIDLARGKTGAMDRLAWRWQGAEAVSVSEFGGVGSGLCLLDGAGGASLLAGTGSGCDFAGCWTVEGKRVKYVSGGTTGGKLEVRFTAGPPPRIAIRGKGLAQGLPSLPLSPPVTLRYYRTDTLACWEATYDANVKANTATRFRARLP